MKSFTEQFEQFADMQKKNLEPLLAWNTKASETFERIARQNHAVAGDWVDYAVSMTQVPANDQQPAEIYESMVAKTRAYGEKVTERSAQFAELAQELGEQAVETATTAVAQSASQAAAKPARKKATKSAA